MIAGLKGLHFGSIIPISHKIKSNQFLLQKHNVLDCEAFSPNKLAALVALNGIN